MTVKDALNRGANFFSVASLSILSTSIIHGLRVSPGLVGKADDVALGVLALIGIIWYNVGRHRFQRSLVPFGLLVAAIAAKVAGMFVTAGMFLTGGADFAIAFFLLLVSLVALWQYVTLRNRDRRWVRRRHGYRI